jgi:hypothetical protein
MSQIVVLPEMEMVCIGSLVEVLWWNYEEYYQATVTGENKTRR